MYSGAQFLDCTAIIFGIFLIIPAFNKSLNPIKTPNKRLPFPTGKTIESGAFHPSCSHIS